MESVLTKLYEIKNSVPVPSTVSQPVRILAAVAPLLNQAFVGPSQPSWADRATILHYIITILVRSLLEEH